MSKKNLLYIFCIISIVVFSTFIRFWRIDTVPSGIWYDEAYLAIDAIQASQENNYHVFYTTNQGREGLYINLIALMYRFFGINIFSARVVASFFGSFTVIGFFFILKNLRFSRYTTIIATFLMATSFWALNFSRLGFRGGVVSFFLVWSILFFILGIKQTNKFQKNKQINIDWLSILYFSLSGMFLGGGAYLYIAARVMPIIFLSAIIFGILIDKKFLVKNILNIIFFFQSLFFALLPIIIFYIYNPEQFVGRSQSVSIFNSPELGSWQSLFFQSLKLHLGLFFINGDINQRHNFDGHPLLPLIWAIFFIIGFFYNWKTIFLSIKNRKYYKDSNSSIGLFGAAFAQIGFWILLIPAIFSIEGAPHALRTASTMPMVFLITAYGIENIYHHYIRLSYSQYPHIRPKNGNYNNQLLSQLPR